MSTVLVADAASALRRMLCSLLEIRGYSVVEAGSGEQAMESLHRQTAGIIVLFDSALTVAGISIVNTLSSASHLAGRHAFVVMHPYFEQPDLSHLPVSFLLEKPFTVDDLQHVIIQAGARLV